jgi:hypothetical protein
MTARRTNISSRRAMRNLAHRQHPAHFACWKRLDACGARAACRQLRPASAAMCTRYERVLATITLQQLRGVRPLPRGAPGDGRPPPAGVSQRVRGSKGCDATNAATNECFPGAIPMHAVRGNFPQYKWSCSLGALKGPRQGRRRSCQGTDLRDFLELERTFRGSQRPQLFFGFLADLRLHGTQSAIPRARQNCDDPRRTRNLARGEREHWAKATEEEG